MKKRWILALAMVLCLMVLSACQTSTPDRFDVKSANNADQNQQNQQQVQQPAADAGDYDPLAEEDDYTGDMDYWQDVTTPAPSTSTPAPTVRSEYAGATPVVIDPIDKPTATPVPELTFTYQVYDATKLGLSFEGPTGWTKDESVENTFIIQNPNPAVDYAATLTIRAEKVSSDYTSSQLKEVVKSMLDAIGTAGFDTYSPSSTATRELLGKTGVYANYSGTLEDGRQIAGRVHAVSVDKVLYTVHITYPKAYTETYKELVYDHLRDTIKITK